MSRALDPESTSNLMPNSAVYEDLVAALCPKTYSGLLEIEFLGKSHPLPAGCNVLVDGNNIAVTKSKLVQAFVFARKYLFQYLKDCHVANHEAIRNATAIVLLMDAENLTAANARKRVIQQCMEMSTSVRERILRRELQWVDGMLTSRLHRHTKSPTLWSHRRWVLEVCQSIGMRHDAQRDMEDVVLVAAERHPRNYYAWLHMRWIFQNLSSSASVSGRKFLATTLGWCLRHPNDTSGFSFLLFYFSLPQHSTELRAKRVSATCQEVIRLAVSFQWTNESVWVFLRTLVASTEVREEQKTAFFDAISCLSASLSQSNKSDSVIIKARDWCIEYDQGALDLLFSPDDSDSSGHLSE